MKIKKNKEIKEIVENKEITSIDYLIDDLKQINFELDLIRNGLFNIILSKYYLFNANIDNIASEPAKLKALIAEFKEITDKIINNLNVKFGDEIKGDNND